MDGLEAEYRALDPVGSGAISRVVLRDRYQGLGPDAGTKKLVEAAGGAAAFAGLQELLQAPTEKLNNMEQARQYT